VRHIAGKDINRRIAAEISWSRTADRSARTRPAREKFMQRFEGEVDPEGALPADERHRRAEHAKRAYMLRLAKRAVAAKRTELRNTSPNLRTVLEDRLSRAYRRWPIQGRPVIRNL
jgi:hypothetical protein